jgi:hypothetical protein
MSGRGVWLLTMLDDAIMSDSSSVRDCRSLISKLLESALSGVMVESLSRNVSQGNTRTRQAIMERTLDAAFTATTSPIFNDRSIASPTCTGTDAAMVRSKRCPSGLVR